MARKKKAVAFAGEETPEEEALEHVEIKRGGGRHRGRKLRKTERKMRR